MIDMTIIDAWLLYRLQLSDRDCMAKAMSLHKFKTDDAKALCKSTAVIVTSSKRGRPESSKEPARKEKAKPSSPEPCIDVRFDGMNHLPKLAGEQIRCRNGKCTGQSRIVCMKCQVHLCLVGKGHKDCFVDYHIK
jgi:hypothetical protein